MPDRVPASSEPRPENPYRDPDNPSQARAMKAWDKGFAAGRAAFDAVVAERDRAIQRADDNVAKFEAERDDERERLSARAYENGWCPTCGRTVGES